MIPGGNKRSFIKLKDELLVGLAARNMSKNARVLVALLCCSDPGLRPLQGKVLRFDPGYLELVDSYGYSPIKKTPLVALGRGIFGSVRPVDTDIRRL